MAVSFNDLLSPVNPLFVAVLRAPVLHWLLSPGLMLISWTGRKSGRPFTIPVGYQRSGEDVVVMISKAAEKTWWRNFREPWPATLRLRGRDLEGTGILVVPGSAEFADRCAATLRRMPWLGSQFGIRYHKRAGLRDAQIETLGRNIAIVRIRVGEGGAP